ncbi:MAG: hypothetical protein JWO59_736 [Chloroflexi bacterium]|nr:hypothetical protein [Chloroflexota bacterium]
MPSLAEQIAQRLTPQHVEAARDAYGQAWAAAAQRANPAPRFVITYEPGFLVVPAIPWFLSHGTRPHNIPGAFGYRWASELWGDPFGSEGGHHWYGTFHPGTAPIHFVETARQSDAVRGVIRRFPQLLFRGG